MSLSSNKESEVFQPFVPASKTLAELSLRAVLLGVFLAIVLGAGNAFLGLKVGMTVSASIPAAVVSMGLLRLLFRNVSILENNVVQTIASAGESVAAGVIFCVPALVILSPTHTMPSYWHVALLSILGGFLGVFLMIPLRRYLIVQEHNNIPFPEGRACASILQAGEKGGSHIGYVVWGGLVGALHGIATKFYVLWTDLCAFSLSAVKVPLRYACAPFEVSPSLIGVGLILGLRMTSIMLAGGLTAWWIVLPLMTGAVPGISLAIPETLTSDFGVSMWVWKNYLRYIGAGLVFYGGVAGFVRSAPIIVSTVKTIYKELFGKHESDAKPERTDRDIPYLWVFMGMGAVVVWMILSGLFGDVSLLANLSIGAMLLVLGFFFVVLSSMACGYVGSSSNPVSGMVITSLALICVILFSIGGASVPYMLAAMTLGSILCVALAIAGDTSQDLKTGFMIGATPWKQQLAEMIGVLVSGLVMGTVLAMLIDTYGLVGITEGGKLPAPQANLMATIVKGVFGIGEPLKVELIAVGVTLAAVMDVLRVPVMPFALGFYLPVSTSLTMFLGGLAAWVIQFLAGKRGKDVEEPTILLASGLVAADALMGVLAAVSVSRGWLSLDKPPIFGDFAAILSMGAVIALLAIAALRRSKTA